MNKPKILICEDELNVLKLMNTILSKADYQIFTAEDGKQALEQAVEKDPDVILLDIRMPKIDGLEVARRIREINKKVKIIFLTGFESPQISQEAAKYDIFDYIVKPVSPQQILLTVGKAVKG